MKAFCGVLSLQSGVIILAFSLIQIGFVVLIANLHVIPYGPPCLKLVLGFVVLLLATGAVMVYSACDENLVACYVSFGFLGVIIVVFLLGSIASFYNHDDVTHMVCVEERCPETMWIAGLKYRKYVSADNVTKEWSPQFKLELEKGTTEEYLGYTLDPMMQVRDVPTQHPAIDIGVHFFSAVAVFMVNLLFFMHCCHIAYGYSRDLVAAHHSDSSKIHD